jgi:hypothetical protein
LSIQPLPKAEDGIQSRREGVHFSVRGGMHVRTAKRPTSEQRSVLLKQDSVFDQREWQ